MNEKNEKLIEYAENELIGRESIRNAVLSGRKRGSFSWRRALLPAAACLAALVIMVFAIPSARAQVLSWFGVKAPEEYLNQDPDERTPIDALEEVIVKPNSGSVTENRVVYAADEPIWQSIAEGFDVTLGETLVDGESMYLAVKLGGLTALPEIDAVTGGSATRTAVPPECIPDIFEEGKAPEEYLDGSVTLWENFSA